MTVGIVDIDDSAAVGLEHLVDLDISFSRCEIHVTPMGTRATTVVSGGRFEGPRLSGEVLDTGGDWAVVGADGIARLDARTTLRTDDGELIAFSVQGRSVLSPEQTDRFLSGEMIRWDEMYGRAAPLFETGAAAYAWLNGVVSVAVVSISLSRVQYRVWTVT